MMMAVMMAVMMTGSAGAQTAGSASGNVTGKITAKVVGTMDATAEGTIPTDAGFRVQAASGGRDARAIADLFRAGLEEAGFQTGSHQTYHLSFRISGDSPHSRRGSSLELSGSEGSSSSGDVNLKMRFKTTSDKPNRTRRGRRLSISISDKDRNPVWQARLELQATDADDLAMVDAVMPALMANIGRTIYALRVP
ncbi:MAG: hypothetical protein HOK30_24725 [Rhodospirillaceae bacterium]|nr:hypothetical protein [Rhodospirillaceae bacterium]